VPPPERIEDWHEILVLAAADRCGLLPALEREAEPAAAAASLGLDARAVRIVCEALEGFGHLERRGQGFVLTERGRWMLGPDAAGTDPMGEVRLSERAIVQQLRLAEVMRSGLPVDDVSGGTPDERERFTRAMRNVAARRVRETLAAVGPPPPGGRLLDAGGGPGTYATAFARAGWAVTVLDLPEPVAVARDALEAAGVSVVAGDMTRELPPGPWECAYLGNVTHLFPPDEAASILARAGAALVPGGLLAVADMVRGRSPQAARFAVLMLVATEGGDTYGEADYRRWMAAAGCPVHRVVDVEAGWHQLLIGRRNA
jgi:SAM-dependent methyltransferase